LAHPVDIYKILVKSEKTELKYYKTVIILLTIS